MYSLNNSLNTITNLLEIQETFDAVDGRSVVVSSSYHIYRVKNDLEKINFTIDVCAGGHLHDDGHPYIPTAKSLSLTSIYMKELIAILFYKLF